VNNLSGRHRLIDGFNVFWLTLAGLATTSFYFSAQFINTNYPDWMYHAFRAQSLMQHGLVSWDYAWDNGLSYWRGYQIVPGLITAGFALLFHVSAARAMVILTIVLFTLFHVLLYCCLRAVKYSPASSILVASLSFAFTGLWVLVGLYSITFAAVFIPPLILLWYVADRNPALRMVYAAAIGASVYIHPLLALSLGLLWAGSLMLRRNEVSKVQIAKELFVIAAISFFYWYGLLFIDAAFVDPYQLTKDFLYTVSGSSQYGSIFIVIVPLVSLTAIFASSLLSSKIKYLFWISTAIYGLIELNHYSNLLNFLDRYQIYRLNFFVAAALLFVLADVLHKVLGRVPSIVVICLIGVAIGTGLSQSLIDGSIFGFGPTASVADPVGMYQSTQTTPMVGSIYINNSMPGSYYHPALHFSNGYNDQLLPQLVNVRFRSLLSQSSPNYSVTSSDIDKISAYAKVLGIEYIFVPQNSPYIQPLASSGYFYKSAEVSTKDFDYVVLRPTWPLVNAVAINPSLSSLISTKTLPAIPDSSDASYSALDLAVQELAAVEYLPDATRLNVSWPAPDRIKITLPAHRTNEEVYLDQSYSRGWHINGATSIRRASIGMMVLAVPAGTQTINMHHTWGLVPYVQLVLLVLAFSLVGSSLIRRKDHV
jgi:hypothetical protein